MSLGSVAAGSAAKLVVKLGGGNELILGFTSTVCGAKAVVAHTGDVGAFALGTLLNQHQTTLLGASERVGGITGAHNGVLM